LKGNGKSVKWILKKKKKKTNGWGWPSLDDWVLSLLTLANLKNSKDDHPHQIYKHIYVLKIYTGQYWTNVSKDMILKKRSQRYPFTEAMSILSALSR
jgi:hypothetical protein